MSFQSLFDSDPQGKYCLQQEHKPNHKLGERADDKRLEWREKGQVCECLPQIKPQ